MPSTNTSGKGRLEKQATGENEGTWGTLLNAVIDAIDRLASGYYTQSVAGSSNVTPDATDDAQNLYHKLTGTLTGNIAYIVPSYPGLFVVENATDGSFTLTVRTSGGSGIAVPQGSKMMLFCDGTNVISVVDALSALSVVGDLTVGGELIMSADQIRDEDFADVSSAATTNLGAVASNRVRITGTTTITSFGSTASGFKFIRFAAALTLTHNATSLILPGSANITTAANDTCLALPLGSGNWIVLAYQRATGEAVVPMPPGATIPYAGTSEPSGWLFCYGQAVSRTTYAALFAAIGTTYGTGDGSTTFNLPDLRGRVVAGQDDMGGTSANRLTDQTGGVNGDTLGAAGGAETHTLTTAQMPSHSHTVNANSALSTSSGSANYGTQAGSNAFEPFVMNSTGGGGAHNNVQPTIILNYIIKT
jgi:microcystin-dependent protein